MICANCQASHDDEAASCPYCRAPRGATGLASAGGAGDAHLDLALAQGLARMQQDPMLARGETMEMLARELERDVAGPLAPSELEAALTRMGDAEAPGLEQLEGFLALGDQPIVLEGIQLGSLLERGADAAAILKRGIVFLKKRRYAEAVEWWSLNRAGLDPTQQRLDLLLLLLEAFTHGLTGDSTRAAATRTQIRNHPLYRELRSRTGLQKS